MSDAATTAEINRAALPLGGRVAMVTGASSGHGRAIALGLAERGAAVLCADIRQAADPDGFEGDIEVATDEAIRDAGGEARYAQADVTDLGQMQQAVALAVTEFGRLDVMVNNAGIFIENARIADESLANWERTMSVNATGVWIGCKVAITQMLKQDLLGGARGRVVNIGSIAGMIGQADLSSYSASKGAVHNLTRALAIECAKQHVNVNAVAPGYFRTAMNRSFFDDPDSARSIEEMHPWGEIGTPDDIGAAVAFLASDEAGWITGAILPVDGGFTAT